MYKQKCGKCLGKGKINAFLHRVNGVCFECGGHGYKLLSNKPKAKSKFRLLQRFTNENCENNKAYGDKYVFCSTIEASTLNEAIKKADRQIKGKRDFIVGQV